jgi:hypothetical protein
MIVQKLNVENDFVENKLSHVMTENGIRIKENLDMSHVHKNEIGVMVIM